MLKNCFSFLVIIYFFDVSDSWKIEKIPDLGCKCATKLKINDYRLTDANTTYSVMFALSDQFKIPSLIVARGNDAIFVKCRDICSDEFSISSIGFKESLETYISLGFLNIIEKSGEQEKRYNFNSFVYKNTQLDCTVDDTVTSCIYKMNNFSAELGNGVVHILILFSNKVTTNCEIPIVSLNPGNNFVVSIAYSNLKSTLENSKFGIEFFYGSNLMPKDGFHEHQSQIYNDEYNPGSFISYIYSNQGQFVMFPNITYYAQTAIMQKSSTIQIGEQKMLELNQSDISQVTYSLGLTVPQNLKQFRRVSMMFGGEDADPYSAFNFSSITFKIGEGQYDKTSFSVGTGLWLILVMTFMGLFVLAGPGLLVYAKIKERRRKNDESEQSLIDNDIIEED